MGLGEQLVTVGAVLAGAAGTYLTSRLTERDRFERDMRVRWDGRRLDAYVAYVTAVKQVYRCAQRALSPRFDGSEPEEQAPLLAELREAEGQRSHAFERVMLLGDSVTVQAAHALNDRVWKLERPARGAEPLTEEAWRRRSDDWLVALNNFHSHARQSLEIPGEPARRDVVPLPPFRDTGR